MLPSSVSTFIFSPFRTLSLSLTIFLSSLSLCIFGSLPISFHFRCNTSSLYEIFIQFFHLLLVPKESHVFVTKLKRESTKGRVKVNTRERERERGRGKKEMNKRERERNRSILCPLLNQVMFDHVFFSSSSFFPLSLSFHSHSFLSFHPHPFHPIRLNSSSFQVVSFSKIQSTCLFIAVQSRCQQHLHPHLLVAGTLFHSSILNNFSRSLSLPLLNPSLLTFIQFNNI